MGRGQSLAFSLNNKSLASRQNQSHFIMILEDDVQCCGTTTRGVCPWAHSHPGAQLRELTGLFHLNAPFIINDHHFNHNSLPVGSPLVMPLSSVGAETGEEKDVFVIWRTLSQALCSVLLHVNKTTQFRKSGWFLARSSSYPQLQHQTHSPRLSRHEWCTPAYPWSL